MFLRIIVAALILFLTACATTNQSIDMSSSQSNAKVFPAEYQLKRVMSLFPEVYAVEIMRVDGVPVKNGRRPLIIDEGQREFTVRVLPPTDGSIVGNMAANHHANKTLTNLKAELQSGKRYVVKAKVEKMSSFLGLKRPTAFGFTIEEYEGVEKPKYPLDY